MRVKLDASEENSPGWKFAEWELRGVPLRLEIGPKDIEKAQVFSARRDTREKAAIPFADLVDARAGAARGDSGESADARAAVPRRAHDGGVDLGRVPRRDGGAPGIRHRALVRGAECEAAIKAETQATLRNIPLGSPRVEGQCVKCGNASPVKAWFAKAY